MSKLSRREFLKRSSLAAGATLIPGTAALELAGLMEDPPKPKPTFKGVEIDYDEGVYSTQSFGMVEVTTFDDPYRRWMRG